MTQDEARRRIQAARVGRLATVGATGQPHVVPICFALTGDRIVSVVDDKPKTTSRLRRLDNVRRNPAVQLVVDHYDDDWSALWWVRISGRARVVERGAEWADAIDELARKYPQYRDRRPSGPAIVIDVVAVNGWSSAGG